MMFTGRKLLIATKHEKEKVIAPILERELGVHCILADGLDTDVLGTFSGEIERINDPITTARNKCHLAAERAHCDLVISSEGSFGSHPTLYFAPADDEFLVFIDFKNKIEIIARELSTETNFNGAEIQSEKELFQFAKGAKFPSHGLILKDKKVDFTAMVKGITDRALLKNTFNEFLAKYGRAFIETDMRAMFNPTRMKVIEKATEKLADKINSQCPSCQTPGFGITGAKQGLPCELCHFPTKSTLSYLYVCQQCTYEEEKQYPHGRLFENPIYCDVCNP